jgi:hypothetical protein
MHKSKHVLLAGWALLLVPLASVKAQGPSTTPGWTAVERTLGRAGAAQPGGAIRFGFPRTDLDVSIGDVRVKPALALGSWLAFSGRGATTEVFGDLVLQESEVAPVSLRLEHGSVDVTAVHNHLLNERPRVVYMHVHGTGRANALAQTLHDALAATRTPLEAPQPPRPAPFEGFDTAQVARVLGFTGKVNGGVYQVSVPRRERIMEGTHEIPPQLGVATALNFQPTTSGKAAVTGDFVLRAHEVNAVLRVLRENGIEVTALHSHMLEEQPRLLFMHFWVVDDAVRTARALRSALDRMNVARASR